MNSDITCYNCRIRIGTIMYCKYCKRYYCGSCIFEVYKNSTCTFCNNKNTLIISHMN